MLAKFTILFLECMHACMHDIASKGKTIGLGRICFQTKNMEGYWVGIVSQT